MFHGNPAWQVTFAYINQMSQMQVKIFVFCWICYGNCSWFSIRRGGIDLLSCMLTMFFLLDNISHNIEKKIKDFEKILHYCHTGSLTMYLYFISGFVTIWRVQGPKASRGNQQHHQGVPPPGRGALALYRWALKGWLWSHFHARQGPRRVSMQSWTCFGFVSGFSERANQGPCCCVASTEGFHFWEANVRPLRLTQGGFART